MSIDPHLHTPVYVQLADLLRQRIEAGEQVPGSALPSEARLTQEYGIGREAARMAISLLRSEGLVRTVRGHGSYVRATAERRKIELPDGSSAITRMPSGAERRGLELDEGVPVLEIRDAKGRTELLPRDGVELTHPASS